MSKEVTHQLRRRSWWDGSVIAECGQRFGPGAYRENWFGGRLTCPGCKTALKQKK